MLAELDTVDWGGPTTPEPITIYCSAENAPRIQEMLYDSYVNDYGCPPDMAREIVYGPPPPEPYRPDPVRVALIMEVAPAHETLRSISRSLAESVALIGFIGGSCATGIRAISRQLREEQEILAKAKIEQGYFEDFQTMSLKDFSQVYRLGAPAIDPTLPEVVKPQKQRGKNRRGHNSDRDRVICKAGYC